MPKYAKDLRAKYDSNQVSKKDFVEEVLRRAEEYAERSTKGEHIVKRATTAWIESGAKGCWVRGSVIFSKAGFAYYQNTTNHGLWPWNEENANVMDRRGSGNKQEYKVKDEFYDTLKKVIAEDAEDIAAFEETANEPLISYDEMVKRLKRDGLI